MLVASRLLFLLLPLVLAVEGALPARVGRVVIPDATRYEAIVTHPGRPYQDFPVEYPPVLVAVASAVHGSTVVGTLERLGFISLMLDVGVAFLLWTGWGRRAALVYLLLGLPLAYFVYFRLDMLSVALALLGMWLVRRGRSRSGGVSLGVAVFAKLWPAALIPLLAARRNGRSVVVALGSIGVGMVLWVLWGGFGGPAQVLTMRGATGWQVESLIGSVQWAFFGSTPRFEAGALRVGDTSAPAVAITLLVALALLAFVYDRSRTSEPGEGIPALAATTILILAAPVLSPQYLCWLLPWAAIAAGARDRSLLAAVGFVTFSTGVMWWLPVGSDALFKGLLLARNAGLILVLAMCLIRLARASGNPLPAAESVSGDHARGT